MSAPVHWTDHDFFPIDTCIMFAARLSLPLRVFLPGLPSSEFHQQRRRLFLDEPQVKHILYRSSFPIPYRRTFGEFASIAGHLFLIPEKFWSVNSERKPTKQTRDLLLPKLISGELDVSDLDIHDGGGGRVMSDGVQRLLR